MIRCFRAFVERDAQLALSYPSTLVLPFLSAVVTVWGFAMLSRIVNPHAPLEAGNQHVTYFTYVVVNLAFMLLLNAALQAVPAAIRRDQVAGTLEAMLASPSPMLTIVIGSALWPVAFGAMQVVAYILAAWAFGLQVSHVDGALLAEFLALGIVCMAAIGALFSAVVIAFKQQPPYRMMAGTAAALLGGVLFPVSLLPMPLRWVSWMLPLTHALRGLRAAMAGAPPSTVAPDAIWLAAAAAALVPLALVVLNSSLRYAKRDGSLSTF